MQKEKEIYAEDQVLPVEPSPQENVRGFAACVI